MTEQRVPAWKRLGLSLTNAKDTAPLPASPATSTKRSRDDADTPKGSKKQRLDQSQNGPNVSSPAQKQLQSSSVAPISSPMPSRLRASPEKSILATPNSKQGHRKSVVFSNDTKKQDGDSAQTYFQAWANDELDYYAQKAAAYDAAEAAKAAEKSKIEESTNSASTQPEVTQETDLTSKTADKESKSAAKEEKKKAKKEKKEKKEGQATKADEETMNKDDAPQTTSEPKTPAVKKVKVRTPKDNTNKPVPDYVRYLEQYHDDRSSWKFNKSKQNDLLKNIWNTYRVPPTCNEALVEYLDGLQGAAARQRLRQAAQSANIDIVSFIRSEIPEVKDEPMETAEARKAAYDTALERQKEILRKNGIDPDPEKTKLLQEQKDYDERVQLVWNTMNKGEPQPVARAAPAVKEEPKVDTARSMRKKRKSRTDVSSSESSDSSSSDDSDSSDSDSDSDDSSSDSDSEDEKPAAKKAKIAKLEAQLADAKIAKLKAKLAKAKATKAKSTKGKKAKAESSSSESDSSDSDSDSSSSSDDSSESDSSSDDSDSD
ncbi:unnamed protein product [Aureobasidium mustum]|uniref:WKF domain-containing protein n=1 Tax=Aureobasidium mustum TaxID=2773714 RepID=A0A9N8JLY3_9PEZI|nr:unnamed protein product [Aureobasidium mustum]